MGLQEFLFFQFLNLYLLFERERESVWVSRGKGRERERETQNLKRVPGSEVLAGSQGGTQTHKPWGHEIITWAKVWHLTDWVTQVPQEFLYFLKKKKQLLI